jgi:hypothetical protein
MGYRSRAKSATACGESNKFSAHKSNLSVPEVCPSGTESKATMSELPKAPGTWRFGRTLKHPPICAAFGSVNVSSIVTQANQPLKASDRELEALPGVAITVGTPLPGLL